MATQDLERLIVKLDADLRSYEKALAKAQGTTVSNMRKIEREVQTSATRVERSFAKMGDTFKNFGKGLLIGAGITGAGALGAFVQETISQTAKIGDLADKLGLSTDALQELQYGAVQADMSFQDMEKSLLRFSKTLGEAANGQGEYLKTLRANGQQIQGSFLGNLRQLADLVANAKNEQEGLLIVSQAMGKGADGMLEFLRDGSAGFDKFATDARNANAIIKDASVRTAQEIDDRWAALMQSLSQMTKKTVIDIVGMFDSLAAAPNTEKILTARERILRQGTRFNPGGAVIPPEKDPVAGSGPEMGRPPVGTNRPTTKVANPEKEAEDKRRLAEADRLAAQAKRELIREREREADAIARQFEAFTGELSRTDEEIAAMRLEAETLGLSTAEIERHRLAQDLLNSANREGIPITADLVAVIEQKATAYGEAAQALEDMAERQAAIEERDAALKDSIKGFAADIRAGIDPIEAMNDALGRLADRLTDLALDMVLNDLFKPGGGGGGGGGLSNLAALVSHKGGVVGSGGPRRLVHPSVFAGARRMHRGGIAGDEVPTILQKGEIVLPKGFKGGRGGGDMKVVINDYAGVAVQTEKRKDQFGREELYLAIDERIANPYSGASVALNARGAKSPVKRR